MVSYNTPFILPSHLLRTSSYMNFFRIQCIFILYKYTPTLFFFIFFFICILFHFFFSCSGMFRDVPECSGMFHVPGLSTALRYCSLNVGSISAVSWVRSFFDPPRGGAHIPKQRLVIEPTLNATLMIINR